MSVFLATIAGFILAYLGLCFVLAWAYVHPRRVAERVVPPGFTNQFLPGPGYDLPAWVHVPDTASVGVVLIHGYGGDRTAWGPLAERLARKGAAVVVPAMRAHGENPARTVGFGPAEAQEVSAAVQWLHRAYPGRQIKVAAVGVSLGGAAVWRAAAARDSGIDAVVTEGTFTELDPAINRWFNRIVPGGASWFGPVRWIATRMAGVDPRRVRPIDDARKLAGRPCLVVHTGQDRLVLSAEAAALAAAATCELWVIPHSRHAHGARDATDEYAQRIINLPPLPVPKSP